MRNILFIILSPFLFVKSFAAPGLDDLIKAAVDKHPLAAQLELKAKISELKMSNIEAAYKPDLSLGASAQYQSDVTKIDINLPFPNFKLPVPEKDQYKVALNANQLLWDGGTVSALKRAEMLSLVSEQNSAQAEIYKVRERVASLYFNGLKLEKRITALDLTLADLNAKLDNVKSAVRNGAVAEFNQLQLEAEIIKVNQSLIELQASRRFLLASLEALTGARIVESDTLAVPGIDFNPETLRRDLRPEIVALKSASQYVKAAGDVSETKLMPKIGAFLQAGYGKPALNMFSNKFEPFYIVGVRANWSFLNWGVSAREKEIAEVQSQNFEVQSKEILRNLEIGQTQYITEIDKLDSLLETDRKLIALRKDILKATASRLFNGTITAAEYVSDLNLKIQAETARDAHEIERVQNLYMLKVLWNN